jgi:Fe2+ transport system protein FeoA
VAGNRQLSLYQAGKRGKFEVTRAPSNNLLENLGIRAGTQLEIQTRYALGGPVLLRVEDAYTVAIGKDIATQIDVAEVAAV